MSREKAVKSPTKERPAGPSERNRERGTKHAKGEADTAVPAERRSRAGHAAGSESDMSQVQKQRKATAAVVAPVAAEDKPDQEWSDREEEATPSDIDVAL